MIALLVATLIGVFITPDGIVIGADTALSNLGGQVASQQKYCITGPRSVATMQGSYLLEDTVTKATVELHNRFRNLCGQVGSSLSPMTLEQQADHIANELKTDLVEFLRASAGGSRHELRVNASRRQNRRDWLQRTRSGERRRWHRHCDRSRNESMGGAGAAACAPDVLGVRCQIPRAGERGHVRSGRTKACASPKPTLQQPDVARLAGLLRGECGTRQRDRRRRCSFKRSG